MGIYSWLDGRRYEGEWVKNNMEGVGCYIWSDGRKYEGEYLDDKKHGFGVYLWSDGRLYEGYWYRGKQHGLGKYKNEEQEFNIKYGLWEDGKRIKWFDHHSEIEAINKGALDYTIYFENKNSPFMTDPRANFLKNHMVEEKISMVKYRIAEIQSNLDEQIGIYNTNDAVNHNLMDQDTIEQADSNDYR